MTMDPSKDWWAPFRVGLYTDKKHRERMGQAIWLYGYLHLYADRQTGRLARNCENIASEIGASTKTVQRWMRLLEKNKYIQLRRLPHGFSIQIEKFRPISKKKRPDNVEIVIGQHCDSDRTIIDSSGKNVVHETNIELRPKDTRTDKNGKSKERFKESIKEIEPVSQESSLKKAATKLPTNPNVKVAIAHYSDECYRIHGVRPHVNGVTCKTFQILLNTKPIEHVNTLITGYLSLADEKLRDKGYPIEWMQGHITRLLMAEKKPERGFVY